MSETVYTPEIIRMVLEMTVKENLTENVRVDYSSAASNYRISVWKKGISAGAVIRTEKQGISGWKNMVRTFENYCRDLKKSVNTMDADAHITLMVLNDLNPEHTLLTVTDGAAVYDFLKKPDS